MASNTIKGLTVSIGADTTKLGKALKDVEAKSRSLSKELGDINKLLKMDPDNAELLAQKQKVLADAVAETSKKLETLKEAERQVQEQFERGEVTEEQMRALQREIVVTQNRLEGYENAARETAEAMDKLADNTEEAGDESQEAAKDVDKLGDEAKDAGKELDNAGDKAAAFGDAAKKAGEVAAAGIAAVAAAGTAAVGTLSELAVEAAAYADEMLTMSTVTGISTDDLQAFNYAAELVDVSVETLTKSMAKNVKSMSSAANDSKTYVAAYDSLGISVTDATGKLRDSEEVYWEAIDALGRMSNETERDAVAMQLFGKSAQELNPLIELGSEELNKLKQEAYDVGAVLSEDSLSALGSFDDSIQKLTGSAGAAKNALGTVLLPELQMLTDTGTDLLSQFTRELHASGGGLEGLLTAIESMSDEIDNAVPEVAAMFVDLIGRILPLVVEAAAGLVDTLLTMVTTELLDMLPAVVDVAVNLIAELAKSIVDLLPDVIDAASQIIRSLVDGLMQAWPQVLLALYDALPDIIQAILDLADDILKLLPDMVEQMAAFMPDLIEAIIVALADGVPMIIKGVVSLLSSLAEIYPQILDAITAAMPEIVDAITDSMPLYMHAIVDMLPEIIDTITSTLVTFYPEFYAAAWELLMALGNAIPEIAAVYLTEMDSILSDMLAPVQTWCGNMVGAAFAMGRDFLSSIGTWFQTIPGNAKAWLDDTLTKIKEWAPKAIEAGRKAAEELVESVRKKAEELPELLLSTGEDLVRGLVEGIRNMTGWLGSQIGKFTKGVLDGINANFDIHSPSGETAWSGKMLDAGLAQGITDNMQDPITAMEEAAAGILNASMVDPGAIALSTGMASGTAAPQSMAGVADFAGIAGKLDQILRAIELGHVLMIDRDQLIGATASAMDTQLGSIRAASARGGAKA